MSVESQYLNSLGAEMSETSMWDDYTPVVQGLPEKKAIRPIQQPRLTVVQSFYHQRPDGEPHERVNRWDHLLDEDEQPYLRERTIKAGEIQAIDTGWVETPHTVLIENFEGKFTSQNPTDEEREEAQTRILSLTLMKQGFDFIIPIIPGDCFRLPIHEDAMTLILNGTLSLRNDSGSPIRYSITVYPA
jgi:hypothetical protein